MASCLIPPWLWPFLLLFAVVTESHAVNRRWTGTNGIFGDTGHWQGGVVPGLLDVAQFGVSAAPFQSTFTVSFSNNATNQALNIEDDLVTFDLNGRIYTVTIANGIVIGNQSGGLPGRLTVVDGTVSSSTNIDVGAAASTSGMLNVGAGGLISGSPTINVGKLGTGTLTVQADGNISSTGLTTIGVGTGVTGTATIIGNGTAGSATLLTGTLNVGNTGMGTVNVQLGGLLQNSSIAVVGSGDLFSGVGMGTVNVTGGGSTWNSLGLLKVGDGGFGEVNITLGGKVMGTDNVIGANLSNSGEVNVNGVGSRWDNSGTITVGSLGAGTLNITNQGVVESVNGFVGNANFPSSTGTIAVNGAGSMWSVAQEIVVGDSGNGTLNITAGAKVSDDRGRIGRESSGTGHVTVDGDDSVWDHETNLVVGDAGDGTLGITAGGAVQNAAGYIGVTSQGTGNVTVDGAGSLWSNSDELVVGYNGEGTLEITADGQVQSSEATVGFAASSTGHVTVEGDGSLWFNTEGITVGESGHGTLEITNRGRVFSSTTPGGGDDRIGSEPGSMGLVTVDGDDSTWVNFNDGLLVGYEGEGTLGITAGGTVAHGVAAIGGATSGTGHVTVDGNNSIWTVSGILNVGYQGTAELNVIGGGSVVSGDSRIAYLQGSGTANVSGAGSNWVVDGGLTVGGDGETNGGTGTLQIQPGATVTVTDGIQVFADDLVSLAGGTLSAFEISFEDGGVASTNFEWSSGTLHVRNFMGDLVNQAGVLAPGNLDLDTTQIFGNYNQLADATLQIEVGGTNLAETVGVGDNAFLGGELELVLANGFVPNSTETFFILAATNIFGEFANVAHGQRLTTSDGLGSFIVNYNVGGAFNPDMIVLSDFLATAVPGDYNQNGIVDAADYTVWRDHSGQTFSLTNENPAAVTPGIVDAEDYAFWKSQFGEIAGSGPGAGANAAVPEPTSRVLFMTVVLVMFVCRRDCFINSSNRATRRKPTIFETANPR